MICTQLTIVVEFTARPYVIYTPSSSAYLSERSEEEEGPKGHCERLFRVESSLVSELRLVAA